MLSKSQAGDPESPNSTRQNNEQAWKYSAKELEDLVTGYKNRKPNLYPDLDILKGEMEDVPGLARALKVNLDEGLSSPKDIQDRIEHFGSNARKPLATRSFWRILKDAASDFTLIILFIASIVSITLNEILEEDKSIAWLDGFGIFVAVAVVIIVSTTNDYSKEQQFLKLNQKADGEKTVICIRGEKEIVMNPNDLVVGDIVKIETGKTIPVDGLLIKGNDIVTDESSMTGESHELKKDSLNKTLRRLEELEKSKEKIDEMNVHTIPSPIILSGTKVTQGDGLFLTVVVGDRSCIGKIMSKILQKGEASPLQMKLEAIATDVGKLGFYTAILTVSIMILRLLITRFKDGGWDSKDATTILHYLLLGLTIIVVAIPEGLPLAVTISLAYSVQKMYAEKNFVKSLMSCEITGGATTICSDKTGTLTENKMKVLRYYMNNRDHRVDPNNAKYEWEADVTEEQKALLIESLCCNSTATISQGNPTEKAFMQMVHKYGVDVEAKKKELVGDNDYVRFFFNSKRKKMSTILKKAYNSQGKHRLYIKGASEIVLKACDFIMVGNERTPLTADVKKEIEKIILLFNKDALRSLSVAYRDLSINELGERHDEKTPTGEQVAEESGLTFISVFGIRDTIRLGVPEAVDACKVAGIKVRMVTGDNKVTAAAIAKECHILPADFDDERDARCVTEGPIFADLLGGLITVCKKCETEKCSCLKPETEERVKNLKAFEEIMDDLTVMARSRPEDKYLLVTGLKQKDAIVAVTGDGTNDAPALKKANVGFAMGIQGTDIAKDAAAIVILDDNFASIVTAVKWGRNIYESIRKFLQFQLSVNIVALCLSFVSAVVISESPLSPIQMLWVNLIMDSLGSLALATEEPSIELLNRPPYSKHEYILSRKMMKHIIGQAIYQIAVLFILLFAGPSFIPEENEIADKYPISIDGRIRTGRRFDYNGNEDDPTLYSNEMLSKIGSSRHYTMIFTLFVFLQLCNEINARRINDKINILEGIIRHVSFQLIWACSLIIQVIITEFGGRVFSVYRNGLTWYQWLIVCAFAAGGWFVRLILVMLPDEMCPQLGSKESDPEKEEINALYVRKNHRKSFCERQKGFLCSVEQEVKQGIVMHVMAKIFPMKSRQTKK